MVSSTSETHYLIPENDKQLLIRFVYQKKKFTKEEISEESGFPEKVVDQFLTDLCYQGTLKFINGRYELATYSDNRYP